MVEEQPAAPGYKTVLWLTVKDSGVFGSGFFWPVGEVTTGSALLPVLKLWVPLEQAVQLIVGYLTNGALLPQIRVWFIMRSRIVLRLFKS